MPNIPQKEAKKQILGKNLILLPKIFKGVHTTPRCTKAALNTIVLAAQAGFNGEKFLLPKDEHPSYYKKVVVPFLKKLTVKALPGTLVFKKIDYIPGKASISYEFSSYMKGEFSRMYSRELKKGKKRKGEGYIITNVDEFFKLTKLYEKMFYLSLCCWQNKQKLELYKTGDENIFDLWGLPKTYKHRLLSAIIKPAMAKIHACTGITFDMGKIKNDKDKITIIYSRPKNKNKGDAKVIIDRHPHIPMKPHDYGATLFFERKFAPPQGNKQPVTTQSIPIDEYIANLIAGGISKEAAMRYAAKKYKTYLPLNRDPKAGMLVNNQWSLN